MPVARRRDREIETAPLPNVRRTAAETPTSQGAASALARKEMFETLAQVGQGIANQGLRIYGRQKAIEREQAEQERRRADRTAAVQYENQLLEWERVRLYDPQTGALNTKGKASFELPEQIDQEFKSYASEQALVAGTPEQTAAFEEIRLNRQQSIALAMRRHVAGEMQTYDANVLNARVKNAIDAAVTNAADPEQAGKELDGAEAAIRMMGPQLGLPAEEIERQVKAMQSSAVTGIIDRLIDTDNIAAANAYYKEWGGLIEGTQVGRIEKALEVGGLRKQAQVESDKIIRTPGLSDAEMRERARTIDNAQLRDEVMQRVEHEITYRRAAREEDDKDRMQRATQIVNQTKSVAGIPSADWSKLTLQQQNALRETAQNLVAGVPTRTHWPTFYRLLEQARDDPAGFKSVNLGNYVDRISASDLEQLATRQVAIANGERTQEEATLDNVMTNQQIVTQAFLDAGLDPTPAAGSRANESVSALRRAVDREVERQSQTLKRKLTNEETRAIVDRAFIEITLVDHTWPFPDVKKRLGEMTGTELQGLIDNATAAAIPQLIRSQAEDWLRRNGRAVTDTELVAMYRRYLLSLQMSRGAQ